MLNSQQSTPNKEHIAEQRSHVIAAFTTCHEETTLNLLLQLGYTIQKFYLNHKAEKPTPLDSIPLENDQQIIHLAAIFDTVQCAYSDAVGNDKEKLIQHLFIPLKYAVLQLSPAEPQPETTTLMDKLWTNMDRLAETQPVLFFTHHLQSLIGTHNEPIEARPPSLEPNYEIALNTLIDREEQLQQIDQDIERLNTIIHNKYSNTDTIYLTCFRLIQTYQSYRDHILTQRQDQFIQQLGSTEGIIHLLSKHQSQTNCLFCCFSPPSITDSVRKILSEIENICSKNTVPCPAQGTELTIREYRL